MRLIRPRPRHTIFHPFQWTTRQTVWTRQVKRTIVSGSSDNGESIPCSPAALVLYNSLSQRKDPIVSSRSDRGIACYCCGPTVYADAHLGHARTYIWFDIFRRVLESMASTNMAQAPPPLFVINITNVDDKILAAASENSNTSPLDHAHEFERKFWHDMDRLNCLRPHVVVRVSDHVEESIVPYIQTLIDKGMAYKVDSSTEGGVLFDVGAFEKTQQTYGKLVPNLRSSSEKETQEGSSVRTLKKDPRDFALWKLKKPNESLAWDSPWGPGRPGWHIECSAMIESVQRQFHSYDFRVHAGGIDLKFPHHSNEIAQAEAYHHCCTTNSADSVPKDASTNEWIPHWMHTGHLHIGGLKMSKSLKNFITIDSQLSQDEEWADDFRLWCFGLSGSYRDPTTYSPDRIEESRNVRTKLVRFVVAAERWAASRRECDETSTKWSPSDVRFFEFVNTTRSQLWHSLLDDLDGTACLSAMLALVEQGNEHIRDDGARYEPVEAAIELLRNTLRLVGFGRRTYDTGSAVSAGFSSHDNKTVLDEFTRFRSTVRRAAIADHKDSKATDNMKAILKACDNLREKTFPSMGVELLDKGFQPDGGDDEWQYCIRQELDKQEREPSLTPSSRKRRQSHDLDVDPCLLFHSFEYAGMYSEYDASGIPTKLKDGTSVSKSQTKKLRKVMEKYERRFKEKKK